MTAPYERVQLTLARRLRRTVRWIVAEGRSWYRRRVFATIYRRREWGSEHGAEFFSGIGSRGEAVTAYVRTVSAELTKLAAQRSAALRVVDLGCGDFVVGSRLLECIPGISYVGCDVVGDLIAHLRSRVREPRASFRTLDIVDSELPEGDVCLIRQVFQHLSNADIMRVLGKLGRYELVIVTEGQPLVPRGVPNPDKLASSGVRFDWRVGVGRGVELDEPPFNLSLQEICRVKGIGLENIVTYRVVPNRPDDVAYSR
jgi:hypothetical protein